MIRYSLTGQNINTNLVGVDEFGLNWSQYAPHQLKLVD